MKRAKTREERIAAEIYDAISRTGENDGEFDVEVEDGDITIQVKGSFEQDGYSEDDYFNGTGAYIITHAYVYIEDVTEIDQDGNETMTDTDFDEVCNITEYLMAG